ncbi:DUF3991 domain-containing protein [Labrys sp. KB_33_2]|uniref:DUF3991 and toprim domain-containing protein n=1 Tax=Labrys sp. KB_33_2 TaxID=3237479 RepID=UPI003F91C16B
MTGFDRELLKAKVLCSVLLETRGWKIDLRESTSKAAKYRRSEGEIIIVIHQGRGWFDPLSDAKGDVFSLARHLGAADFAAAIQCVSELVGFVPRAPLWQRRSRHASPVDVCSRWSVRRLPVPGSPAWTYLTEVRAIPDQIVDMAVSTGKLREGTRGTIWAAHTDPSGDLVGWEERGPQWRGFATQGAKALFLLGQENSRRVCITEAAIDAMSLAALENYRTDSVYASTGGGWAPATEQYVRALASRRGAQIVAGCDANDQGDIYAARLRDIALAQGAGFVRLWPGAVDWNDEIVQQREAGRRPEAGLRASA